MDTSTINYSLHNCGDTFNNVSNIDIMIQLRIELNVYQKNFQISLYDEEDIRSFSSDEIETIKLGSPRLSRRAGIPEDFYTAEITEKRSNEGWSKLKSIKSTLHKMRTHSKKTIQDDSFAYFDLSEFPLTDTSKIMSTVTKGRGKLSKWNTIRSVISRNRHRSDQDNSFKVDENSHDTVPISFRSLYQPPSTPPISSNGSKASNAEHRIPSYQSWDLNNCSPYISASKSLATFKMKQKSLPEKKKVSTRFFKITSTTNSSHVRTRISHRFGDWKQEDVRKIAILPSFKYPSIPLEESRVKRYLEIYKRRSIS